MISFKEYIKENFYNIHEASGTVIYSEDSERVLFLKRSEQGEIQNTWAITIGGGKEDSDSDSYINMQREVMEEIGGTTEIVQQNLIDVYMDTDKISGAGFKYNTFFTIVKNDFVPSLNHEHSDFIWVNIDTDRLPEPLHFGTIRLLNTIKRRMSMIGSQWTKRNIEYDWSVAKEI